MAQSGRHALPSPSRPILFWILHHLHVENKHVGRSRPNPSTPPQKRTCRAELSKKSAACFVTTHLLSLLIPPYLSKCHMVHSVLPLLFPSNTDLRSGMVSRKTGARLPGWNHTLTYGGNNCSQRGPICLFLISCVVYLNLFVPLFF